MKILDYIFYSFYCFIRYVRKTGIEHYQTISLLTILQGFNIFTIIGIIEINRNDLLFKGRNNAIAIGVVMIVINYFMFIYNNRYKKIIERYSKEKYGSPLGAIIYFILSIWLMWIITMQVRDLNKAKSPPYWKGKIEIMTTHY